MISWGHKVSITIIRHCLDANVFKSDSQVGFSRYSMDPNTDVDKGQVCFLNDDEDDDRNDETRYQADTNEQEGEQQGVTQHGETSMIRPGVRGGERFEYIRE